jgi:hypothetical protein
MPELIVAAGNAETACVAVLEKLGFVVVTETNGDVEEWVALRDDLHLRAESPVQLLRLYSMRHDRRANWAPADAEVEALLERMKSE